jgi:hypothetical protein
MEIIEISNVASLIEAVRSQANGGSHKSWFRGHSDTDWKLVPSVHRDYSQIREVELNARFRFGAPTRYANCPGAGTDEFAKWICLMQHYGLPTRLLDWTESPLVAAFFAVSYEPMKGSAAIWQLFPGELNAKMGFRKGIKILPGYEIKPLLYPAFAGGESPDIVLAVMGQEVDLRMSVQQGAFTIHGNNKALECHTESATFLRKIVIPESNRETLRKELSLLGIRRSMLFPDIQNLARELALELKKNGSPANIEKSEN